MAVLADRRPSTQYHKSLVRLTAQGFVILGTSSGRSRDECRSVGFEQASRIGLEARDALEGHGREHLAGHGFPGRGESGLCAAGEISRCHDDGAE